MKEKCFELSNDTFRGEDNESQFPWPTMPLADMADNN
jgi:hypothetical protein